MEEPHALRSRYIELTARFKASWTFYRFFDSLQKFLGEGEAVEFDFQSLYKRLKGASALVAVDEEKAAIELDAVAQGLAGLLREMDARDAEISASHLRKFFERSKTSEAQILIEMVRFYQEIQRDRSWESERVDKVDFLVSRLGEQIVGNGHAGGRRALERVLERLSDNMRLGRVDPLTVHELVEQIRSIHAQMRAVESFAELTEQELVAQYRRLKHSLGPLFFEHSILRELTETNALLRRRIAELAEGEEDRIFEDYERLAELEEGSPVGNEVRGELAALRSQVDALRERIKGAGTRLADLGELRDTVEAIQALIDADADLRRAEGPLGGRDLFAFDEARRLLASDLDELVAVVASSDPELRPDQLAAAPELLSYRLDPREITAYLRLAGDGACDERLESFVLTAALLRWRLAGRVESIAATEVTGAAQSSADRRLLELGDWYLKQFPHFVESAMESAPTGEAHQLQRARMRLTREHAELWLRR